MADEYSDEEFAADDAEPAYDAEFDDDGDGDAREESGEAAVNEVYLTAPSGNDQQEKERAPVEKAQPEHDSEEDCYDAEFDDHDAEFDDHDAEQAGEERETALSPKPESSESIEDSPMPAQITGATVSPEFEIASPPFVEKVSLAIATSSHSVARRSSDSRLFASSVPQIERFADPDLELRLMRRRSSPRVRPAPIARLASLGELAAAAPDELEIPTNDLTAEAAALVCGGVMVDTASAGLVKRTSSTSFVPRLPSLHEISLDLPGALGGAPMLIASSEPDDDSQVGNGSKRDDGKVDLNSVESCGEDDEYSDDEDRDDEPNDEPASAPKVQGDEPSLHAEDVDAGAIPLPEIQHTGVVEDKGEVRSGISTQTNRDESNNVTLTSSVSGTQAALLEDNEIARTIVDPALHVDSNARDDRLKEIVAEVGTLGVVKDGDEPEDRNARDEDYFVDVDNRRETNVLLEEAQMLINQHVSVEPAIPDLQKDSSANGNDLVGQYATGWYPDDESFSDEYDEDDLMQQPAEVATYDVDFVDGDLHEDPDVSTTNVEKYVDASPVQPSELTVEHILLIPVDPSVRVGEYGVVVNDSPTDAVQVVEVTPSQNPSVDQSPEKDTSQNPESPLKSMRTSFQLSPRSPSSRDSTSKRRATSYESAKTPVRPQSNPAVLARKPAVPRFERKAPVPRQQHRSTISPQEVQSPVHTVESPKTDRATQTLRLKTPVSSPMKGVSGSIPSIAPPQKELEQRSPSPSRSSPRKPSVFKQKKSTRSIDTDPKRKKLKPVKCPPNLRIDLPHVDKEKREWLLLNMFRHGDDTSKYDPFIPTMTPELTTDLHLVGGTLKRPLSARQIYGAYEPQARTSVSRGAYGHHTGRRIVDPPVDLKLRELERNWVSTTPSVTSIPAYDSILDKYCKTVTSPVVQRRIYQTRMDDLSPQLAMVLEKRAFKEWKCSETDGFGAVSNSYIIVATSIPATLSVTTLHTPRPPTSSQTTLTSVLPTGS